MYVLYNLLLLSLGGTGDYDRIGVSFIRLCCVASDNEAVPPMIVFTLYETVITDWREIGSMSEIQHQENSKPPALKMEGAIWQGAEGGLLELRSVPNRC